MNQPVRILIVGGGYVGMYTALGIQRKLARRAEITVVDPQSNMTYQPFLPEAAAGSVEPRHVVVSLRRVLRRCRVLTAAVTRVEQARRVATLQPIEGESYEVPYDLLVMCTGSVSRLLPIPGLADHGIGFKTIGEAIFLRNHVLSRLYLAASTPEAWLRRRALTFVFVGGGYAGVEAIAELEDMARYALRTVDGIEPRDMRWVLVEAADRIMPEVSPSLASYTQERLAERGIDVRLSTRLESAMGGRIVLSDGDAFDSDTLVWTAGVKANPMLGQTGLPLDAKGRLPCHADLTVRDVDGVFAAGDCAAVPDLSKIAQDPDAVCAPSAQHAVRQAKRLAGNLVATVHGRPRKDYVHAYAGSVASLGLYRGVAEIYGIKLRGILAWFMHRTYHVSRMPTFNRKVRVLADWTAALFFRREVVALGQLQRPRTEFELAAGKRELP
ncbi:NAD(P)/FAD-dependent oxidoreductase [Nonomuraea sediminis]|uniref:NAD(P)/FAD-dependent oxidoreductase n=1 Tax=Nonomuraea sediminis TaxID=2835864 RepID=UPI001BDC693B|nr:NAD(P)/FAD-dependent oxidoreductase [Nonomuraea sediminis]